MESGKAGPGKLVTHTLFALLLSLLLLIPGRGNCIEPEEGEPTTTDSAIGIDGLVMNQARTRLGSDFARYFSSHWQPLPGIEGYNIFVTDKVHPRFGTWVFISVNEAIMHRERLNTRLWEIEEAAKKAVVKVGRYVEANFGDRKSQLSEKDLLGDGL